MTSTRRLLPSRCAAVLAAALLAAAGPPATGEPPGEAARASVRPEAAPERSKQLAWPGEPLIVRTAHYRIRSDLDPQTTRRLGDLMDRMCLEYQRLFAGLTPRVLDRQLWIAIFATQEGFTETLRQRYGVDAGRARGAAVRSGSELVLAAWLGDKPIEALERTLRHEGFHQFEHLYFRELPRWLSEGLAQLYESAVVLQDGVVLGEVEPEAARTLATLRRGSGLMPWSDLLSIDAARWSALVAQGRIRQYVESWSIVHFLLFSSGSRHRPAFDQFLIHMNQGRPWPEAFEAAFGAPPERAPFADRWEAYAAALRPTDLAGTIAHLEFLTAGLGALSGVGVHPETLEGLRGELQRRGFLYETRRFGIRRTLSATDEGAFLIPRGGDARFVLVPGAAGVPAAGPARIAATRGLRPLELRIEWEPPAGGAAARWALVGEAPADRP